MKNSIVVVLAMCLLFSCKKNTDNTTQALLEHYPQKWILTVDDVAPDRYSFIRTNGANMFRKIVDKSYSLVQLAIDEECQFEVAQSRNEANNKDCYTLRLDKDKRYWCGAGPSTNRQEMHMGTYHANNLSSDPGDGYKFLIHDMPKTNGVKTVAIESLYYPGYYVSKSPPGFNYAQNQLTLEAATDPKLATHWQCR